MTEVIILIVALAALCCMAAMATMIYFALFGKKEESMRELTEEEKEAQRLNLEQQRLALKGLQDMFAWDGTPGGRK